MNVLKKMRPISLLSSSLALLTGFLATLAQATTVEINAKFSPDPTNPRLNAFINTTPNSGLCNTFPMFCESRGLHSILLGFEAQSQKPILANHTDIRQGAMIKVPAQVRIIQVRSETGQAVDLEFSITAFSGTNRTRDVRELTGRPPGSSSNTAQSVLWNGAPWGFDAPDPCLLASGAYATSIDADYFWQTPEASACGKSPAFDIDSLLLRNASVSYLMITPEPLKMESGIYRGSITYDVGPGKDFDFGDVLLPTKDSVTFNFTLDIQHILKFLFPAGADRLALNPAGGWQQWINHGRRPEKLVADQDFKMWSSTSFSMKLQCEHTMGMHCGIKNPAGDAVAVETRVTLPSGLQDDANQPVTRYPLSTVPAVFMPTYYVDNGRAALHFEVGREQVKGMTEAHSGSTYSGNVTIIWDSNITP